MATWICPDCRRPFGRVKQGHMCAPGLSLKEYFDGADERERPIFVNVHDVSEIDDTLLDWLTEAYFAVD